MSSLAPMLELVGTVSASTHSLESVSIPVLKQAKAPDSNLL
jgi:hypothetical protein